MLFTASPGKFKAVVSGGLLLFGAMACANRNWSDWANVQALKADTRTEVQLYKDAAAQENRKVKGHVLAVTDDSITLQFKDGQQHTLRKQDVHRVRSREPFSNWRLFLGTLARTAGYIGGCYLWGDGPTGELLSIAIPAAIGSETWSQLQMWKVYEADPHESSPVPRSIGGESESVQVGVLEDKPDPDRFTGQ